MHHLPFLLQNSLQIHTELEHITSPCLGVLREQVLNDIQVLKERVVLVIELTAFAYAGIGSFRSLIAHRHNLTIDLYLPGQTRINLYFAHAVFNILICHLEYGGLADVQRETAVLTHVYCNRIAFIVLAIPVVNTCTDVITIFVLLACEQRLYLVVILIILKCCPELILLVDKPFVNTIGDLLFHNKFIRADDFQVKLNVQVGSACASLHIEGLEVVVCVIRKGIALPFNALDPGNQIILFLCALIRWDVLQRMQSIHENGLQVFSPRKAGTIRIDNLTCGKINASAQGFMNAADVQHKNTVDVYPHVIIAGEFEDHGISVLTLTIFQLGEV